MSTKAWSTETMEIINRLTPDVKGKGFDPDWFLLRQRFEGVDALRQAAGDFVSNVDNQLIEGAGEMPLRVDASFRELRKAVNEHTN